MLTKSTMIVRDLELYVRLGEVADVSVCMSVGTLDEDVRRVVEPGTPPGRKRLEILGRFAAAGIRTGVLVAPVLPGLTDDDAHLDEVLPRPAPRRASRGAAVIPLHVRPGIRDHFVPWLARRLPAARRSLRAAVRRPRLRAARRTQEDLGRAVRPRCASTATASPAPAGPVPTLRSERGRLARASVALAVLVAPERTQSRHGRCHIEDYAIIGDTETVALVWHRRVDRLAVHAPFRLDRVLRRAPRGGPEHGRWQLTPQTGRAPRSPGATWATRLVLETEFTTDTGVVAGDRLHAAAGAESPDGRAHRRRPAGQGGSWPRSSSCGSTTGRSCPGSRLIDGGITLIAAGGNCASTAVRRSKAART